MIYEVEATVPCISRDPSPAGAPTCMYNTFRKIELRIDIDNRGMRRTGRERETKIQRRVHPRSSQRVSCLRRGG